MRHTSLQYPQLIYSVPAGPFEVLPQPAGMLSWVILQTDPLPAFPQLRHVPVGVRTAHPTIPWRQVVGVGNVIRHDYDQIDDLVMWTTATERLLPLKAAVEAMLRDLDVG